MNKKKLIKRGVIAGVVVGLLIIGLFVFRGNGTINPNKDKALNPADGTAYAVLYKQGDVYAEVGRNDEVLRSIQKDLWLFARKTIPKLSDAQTRVGFTFNKGFETDKDARIYTGRFYGVDDSIRVTITPHGKGVYTLSVTNIKNGTNIDGQLSLNGQRNAYIRKLPIEEIYYSIRYQLTEDRIVATFYDGYSASDVDAVEKSVKDGLGENYKNEVVFNINRKGIYSLEDVRLNLVKPFPEP